EARFGWQLETSAGGARRRVRIVESHQCRSGPAAGNEEIATAHSQRPGGLRCPFERERIACARDLSQRTRGKLTVGCRVHLDGQARAVRIEVAHVITPLRISCL